MNRSLATPIIFIYIYRVGAKSDKNQRVHRFCERYKKRRGSEKNKKKTIQKVSLNRRIKKRSKVMKKSLGRLKVHPHCGGGPMGSGHSDSRELHGPGRKENPAVHGAQPAPDCHCVPGCSPVRIHRNIDIYG